MKIRRAIQSDLAGIVDVEKLCFPEDTAFPPAMFAYLLNYAVALVAGDEDIEGFIIGYPSGKMGIIYTLDVHPDHRRKGVGRALMIAMERELWDMGARRVRLEAAVSNPGALELYHKAGYREHELVKNYYGRGKDALCMFKDLGG
jgi:[ribosomal protein S18]-alanine N-acetyltransferase